MKKEGYITPVIVLTVICLAFAFLLGYVNSITSPIIEAAAIEEANIAKQEVLPEGDEFTEVTDLDLPEGVTQAFYAENGAGHVFICEGAGYGGTMQIIVGIDADGLVTGTQVLSHSETAGLGARVAEEAWNSQFPGQDSSLSGVTVISGSSVSSNCFIDLVKAAFEANDMLISEGV